MRKHIVAGNWKLNNTIEEGKALAQEVVDLVKNEVKDGTEVVMCVPFTSIASVKEIVSGSPVKLGAQNCYTEASGAFTGEISAPMLKSAGVDYVIIGHSERREYFGETDDMLAKKVDIVLANGMQPIFCCGEVLAQREAGNHVAVVKEQLSKSLFHLSADEFAKVVIAYEPVWAIGTGVTATSDQAQEMHKDIRNMISEKYGQEVAENTTIQYGGSCKPGNAKELFACPDVDGGLIGGASLKARDFVDIAKSF